MEPEPVAAIRVVPLVPVEPLPALVLVARVVLPLPVITDTVTSAVPDTFVVAVTLGAVPVPRVVEGVKSAVDGTVEHVSQGWILKGALVLVPVNASGGPTLRKY